MKSYLAVFLIPGFVTLLSCEKEESERQIDPNYNPLIIPQNFVDSVTNIYFPLRPGETFTYHSQIADGLEITEVTVQSEKRIIAGINCTVVRDVVSLDGQVIEDTFDWYAQDKDGNVWYFGEEVEGSSEVMDLISIE